MRQNTLSVSLCRQTAAASQPRRKYGNGIRIQHLPPDVRFMRAHRAMVRHLERRFRRFPEENPPPSQIERPNRLSGPSLAFAKVGPGDRRKIAEDDVRYALLAARYGTLVADHPTEDASFTHLGGIIVGDLIQRYDCFFLVC